MLRSPAEPSQLSSIQRCHSSSHQNLEISEQVQVKPPASPPLLFPLHLLTIQFTNTAHLWQGPQSTTEDKKPYLAPLCLSLSTIFLFLIGMLCLSSDSSTSSGRSTLQCSLVCCSCHCSSAPHQSISKNISDPFSLSPGVRGNKCLC